MDHNRPLLQEHCCQLLVNLLVVLVTHKTDHFALTRTIIYNKDKHQESLLSVSSGSGEKDSSFMGGYLTCLLLPLGRGTWAADHFKCGDIPYLYNCLYSCKLTVLTCKYGNVCDQYHLFKNLSQYYHLF